MAEAILDTDAASRLQSAQVFADLESRLAQYNLTVTFVTAAELLRGALKAKWGDTRMRALHKWLERFPIIHSDDEIVQTWAEIVAASDRGGHNIGQNDAWNAACARASELPLVTFNRKHFDWIEGLEVLS